MTYDDNSGYLNYNLVLTNIGDLNVRTGNLTPALGSSLLDSMPLAVASGATLGLQNLDNEVYVGNFSGGGILVLEVTISLKRPAQRRAVSPWPPPPAGRILN